MVSSDQRFSQSYADLRWKYFSSLLEHSQPDFDCMRAMIIDQRNNEIALLVAINDQAGCLPTVSP
jgi:hypothetical protein